MKRSRLSRRHRKRKIHRLQSGEAYAFSVTPPKGRKFFNEAEMQFVAATQEAVVQDDVIDMYFTSKSDAIAEKKWLLGRGFRVTKIEIQWY